MKDNEGFSLIEIIIVLCIAALLVTGTAISLKMLQFADSEFCAKEIDSAMDTLRMNTMSQGDKKLYLVIEWDTVDKEYYISYATANVEINSTNWKTEPTVKITNRKKIASSQINLYHSTDGINYSAIRDAQPVIFISFVPNSGAFASADTQIKLESSSKTCIVYMVKLTGNHYIK